MLVDGHLRAETTPDVLVPVLVLDVTEEEAEKLLLTIDPLAAMAEADADRIVALLKTVQTESEAVQELLRRTAGDRLWAIVIRTRSARPKFRPRGPTSSGPSGAPSPARFGKSACTGWYAAIARTRM